MNVTPENPNQNPNRNPSAPTISEIEENSSAPRTSRVFGSRTYQLEGRYPIPQATLEYRGENRERIQFGKKMEIDPNQLPAAKQQGTILELPSWNPQLWAEIIDQWERDACRAWINRSMDGEMFEFLETLLGPTVELYWNTFKRENPTLVAETQDLGENPYNFTSLIKKMFLGSDVTVDSERALQNKAIEELEVLQLTSWYQIESFCNDFLKLVARTGQGFDDNLNNRIFDKLSSTLGKQIKEKWLAFNPAPQQGAGPRFCLYIKY
ncbi:hypothetical protein SLE2022_327440 [Rubroshorea leprosula]